MTPARLSPTSAALVAGDVVCLEADANGNAVVTKAVAAALLATGSWWGISQTALAAGARGQFFRDGDSVTRYYTGLTAAAGPVRVSSTARAERVAGYVAGDFVLGTADTAGRLFLARQATSYPTGTITPGLVVAEDRSRIDRLTAQYLTGRVDLTSATEQIISLAGGAHRVVQPATLVADTSIVLAQAGAAYDQRVTIERHDTSSYRLRIINEFTAGIVFELNRPGRATFVYTGTWRLETQGSMEPSAVFNVRDYGAKTGVQEDNNRAAFHRAFDAAARAPSGGVVQIDGEFRIIGSLITPRLPTFRNIRFRGNAWNGTSINRHDAGPLWECDQALDAVNGNGVAMFVWEHMTLAVSSDDNVWVWKHPQGADPPPDPPMAHYDNIRPYAWIEHVCFRGSGTNTKPLLYIERGWRMRIVDCTFYGMWNTNGFAIELDRCGGTVIDRCNGFGLPGGFLHSRGGGELTVIGCRDEGGINAPGWKFVNCNQIVLINSATEGKQEGPAIYYFENCSDVHGYSMGVAQPNLPYTGDKYGHGVMLVNCCHVRLQGVWASNDFAGLGDGTARAIHIDADCKDVQIERLNNGPGLDIVNLGTNCVVENTNSTNGAVTKHVGPDGWYNNYHVVVPSTELGTVQPVLIPKRSGTGANSGSSLIYAGQPGQNQSGGAANTNGGGIFLASGSPGTGGGGAAGARGDVSVGDWDGVTSTVWFQWRNPGSSVQHSRGTANLQFNGTGYIELQGSSLYHHGATEVLVRVNAAERFWANATGVSVFGVQPVARQPDPGLADGTLESVTAMANAMRSALRLYGWFS